MARLHLRSAAILRANGRASEAGRVERFAARTRLMVDEPKATRRMHALARELHESPRVGLLFERALEGTLSLVGGDFGNVQIRDPIDGSLRIAVQYGFTSEFLEYFAIVDDDRSACGRAASQRSQTVIVDVNEDAAFAPHRGIAAASRFRAVQSTPLVDGTGRLRGVISTHYRHSHRPSGRDLELVQWYAEHVAAAIARQQHSPTALYEASARLHAQTADLHDSAAALMSENALALVGNGETVKAATRQDWARRANEHASQERERVQALTARAQRTSATERRNGLGRRRDPAEGHRTQRARTELGRPWPDANHRDSERS